MGNPVTREVNAIYCKYKPDLSLPSLLIPMHGLSLAQRTKSLGSTQVFWGSASVQFSKCDATRASSQEPQPEPSPTPLSSLLHSLNSL